MKPTQGTVTPISGTAPAAGPAAPVGPAFVLEAQTRLAWIEAKQLPQLARLCETLGREASQWDGEALELALADHLDAVQSLRFELLVGVGLRAGPLGRDQEAFRAQVARVSARTEAAWAEIRRFLEQAEPDTHAEEAFSDFILEVRSVQRGVAELMPQVEQLGEELKSREAEAATALGRQALAELSLKAATVMRRLQQLGAVHAAGYEVQRFGYALRDELAAGRAALRRLAQSLGRGLLERLRALIALDHFAAGEDIQAAQQSRDELQAQLASAIEQVVRLQDKQRTLAQALASLRRHLAAAGTP